MYIKFVIRHMHTALCISSQKQVLVQGLKSYRATLEQWFSQEISSPRLPFWSLLWLHSRPSFEMGGAKSFPRHHSALVSRLRLTRKEIFSLSSFLCSPLPTLHTTTNWRCSRFYSLLPLSLPLPLYFIDRCSLGTLQPFNGCS